MQGKFYNDIERLKRLNRALCDDDFFAARGYDDIFGVPEEIKELAFPVYSPVWFVGGDAADLLDIGCGAGLDMYLLKKKFPHLKLAGVDSSRELLVVAARYVKGAFIEGDADALSFHDKSFDGIIINGAFNLLNDTRKFLGVCRRILRDNGFIYIADLFKKRDDVAVPEEGDAFNLGRAMTPKAFFSLCRDAGFVYERGHFEPGFTKEFGIFAVRWRKK